mgnify:CR=1 FL=1
MGPPTLNSVNGMGCLYGGGAEALHSSHLQSLQSLQGSGIPVEGILRRFLPLVGHQACQGKPP